MTEHIQLLDDLGAEFARVAAEAERTSRRPSAQPGRLFRAGPRARALAIALGIAALIGGGTYAVPATRAAVDGIADSFAGWVSGDSDRAPGRALEPGDNVPHWFSDSEGGEARLIAEADGVGLYVRRADSDEGPMLEFGLGEGLAMVDTLEGWRQRLGQHAVVVLGPALLGPRDVLDDRGRFPLLGLTTRDVKRVELHYFDGPSLVGDTGDGGFVLLADAWRRLREVVAYDATGRVLERADMRGSDMRYLCEKEPAVCPPEESSSSR
ncbi:MAG: hypothetical protein QOD71_1762 [Thermoleophilaceae bacterium]|jgi:hypothetical protein|nr:hypothetical protein [Thermoleophilaceae bacterium]